MMMMFRGALAAMLLWAAQAQAAQFSTMQATLSGVGTSAPFQVTPPLFVSSSAGFLPPAILASLSSGASLTYSIQVTGDNCLASGYNAATGNWVPFTGMAGLTASAASTLGAAVVCIRASVTSWTSGTLVLQFVQQGN